jgi:ABC-2 type transport system ATP-binding protein
VLAAGTPDELKDRVGGERLEIRLDDAGRAQAAVGALASLGDDAPEIAGDLVTVGVRGRGGAIVNAVRALDLQGIGIADIVLRRPTLDDVFLALTGHAAEEAVDAHEAKA